MDFNEQKDFECYPSVTNGPINVQKALSAGFQPTSIEESVKTSIKWYHSTWKNGNCKNEFKETLEELEDEFNEIQMENAKSILSKIYFVSEN